MQQNKHTEKGQGGKGKGNKKRKKTFGAKCREIKDSE